MARRIMQRVCPRFIKPLECPDHPPSYLPPPPELRGQHLLLQMEELVTLDTLENPPDIEWKTYTAFDSRGLEQIPGVRVYESRIVIMPLGWESGKLRAYFVNLETAKTMGVKNAAREISELVEDLGNVEGVLLVDGEGDMMVLVDVVIYEDERITEPIFVDYLIKTATDEGAGRIFVKASTLIGKGRVGDLVIGNVGVNRVHGRNSKSGESG